MKNTHSLIFTMLLSQLMAASLIASSSSVSAAIKKIEKISQNRSQGLPQKRSASNCDQATQTYCTSKTLFNCGYDVGLTKGLKDLTAVQVAAKKELNAAIIKQETIDARKAKIKITDAFNAGESQGLENGTRIGYEQGRKKAKIESLGMGIATGAGITTMAAIAIAHTCTIN